MGYVMTIPARMGHEANEALASAGQTEIGFRTFLRSQGEPRVALHLWEDPSPYLAALPQAIRDKADTTPHEGTGGAAALRDVAQARGLSWDALLPILPYGQEVQAGDIFLDPGTMEPIKIVQTHTPSPEWIVSETPEFYTFLENPFRPGRWKKPVGEHDAYQPTNVIGAPTKVVRNGRVWRNDTPNNVWEPGSYDGWVDEGPADA